MITAVVVAAVWPVVALPLAVVIGRALRALDRRQPEPDFLWNQPTDVLSQAAVDARFDEITSHIKVRR